MKNLWIVALLIAVFSLGSMDASAQRRHVYRHHSRAYYQAHRNYGHHYGQRKHYYRHRVAAPPRPYVRRHRHMPPPPPHPRHLPMPPHPPRPPRPPMPR